MTINIDELRKKIIYRSNYRGTKEMDNLLGSFTRKYINSLDKKDLIERDREKLILDTLRKVELDTSILNRYPHEFSGGQRQRIAIARAIVLKPRFLILDEPTSALDLSVQSQIVSLLKKLQKENKLGYIFISHDLRVVRSLAHQLIVLKNGRIVESGSSDQIFKKPKQKYTEQLISAAFEIK